MRSTTAPHRVIERDPQPQHGQKQAIEQLDRDLIVSAGAGSGKTWVLTERYIEMLNAGTRPREIIAITFTEKAAAEMKGRIREAVQKMAHTAEREAEAAYWRSCRQELERATVTTIHGFCARLLRNYPLEAAVDPHFQVMDGTVAELRLRRVLAEAVERWMVQNHDAAEQLYVEFGSRRTILQTVHRVYEQWRTYHVRPEDVLRETTRTLDLQRVRFTALRDELVKLADQGQSLVGQCMEGRKTVPKYLRDAEAWLANLERGLHEAMHWDGNHDTPHTAYFQSLASKMWRNSGPDELKALHRQLKTTLYDWLLHTEAPDYRDLIRAVLDVTAQVARSYETQKRQEQALDFHDLETMTCDMLQAHPQLAVAWRQHVRYVMVDEFQDTNALQKTILDLLIGQDKDVKRFVVGDGKQSIYKFRGADVAVFHRIGEEIRQQGGQAVSLDVNFRTQHRLIAYINALFGFLMQKRDDDPDYVIHYEPLVAHRQPPHTDATVELLPVSIPQDSHTERGEDPRQKEAARLASRIRSMVDHEEPLIYRDSKAVHVTYGDVAILLASRTHLHTYEQALRDEGIPYDVIGGRGFYDRQEVLDVLNVLKLIQNRDDELALLAYLRSPFVHVSDESLYWLTRGQRLHQAFFYLETAPQEVPDAEWGRLRQARHRLLHWERVKQTEGVYRLIRDILQETGFLSVLLAAPNGDQAALNVEKLLDLARDVDREGLSLADFLDEIRELQQADMQETEASIIRERGNAVVLMTIHASKGLEFPVVALPDLSRQIRKGAESRALYMPGQGLAIKKFRAGDTAEGDGLYDTFLATEQDRELQESIRLFYVAATRARDYLLLVGSQKEQKNPSMELKHNWLDWIVKHLGGQQLCDLVQDEYAPEADWSVKVTWGPEGLPSSSTDEADEDETRSFPIIDNKEENRDVSPQSPEGEMARNVLYPLYAPIRVQPTAESQTFSVSSMMDYDQCVRLYMLKHVWQLPQPMASAPTEASSEEPALTGIQFGNVLHRVMENVTQRVNLDDQIEHACRLEGFDKVDGQKITPHVKPLVEHYQRSGWFRIEQESQAVWNELPFYYRLADDTISGVIDKVLVNANGKAIILDFKTNRIRGEAHLQRLVSGYALQMDVYTAVVRELLNMPVKEAVLYFLRDNRPIHMAVDHDVLEGKHAEWRVMLHDMKQRAHATDLPDCEDLNCPCHRYF